MARHSMLLLGLLASLLCVTVSLADGPIDLTAADFDSRVKGSSKPWLIGFFAPWCGHCNAMKPAWEEAAVKLKGKVFIGSIDATVEKDLASSHQIKGYPTIKWFGANSNGVAKDYGGGRATEEIIKWVNQELGLPSESDEDDEDGATKLTESNFDENVKDNHLPWLVGFFAPWCGHCKAMKPAWDEAARKLRGKANLGSVDATQNKKLVQEYKLKSYPTIKWFPPHSNGEASGYGGGRAADQIVEWVTEKINEKKDDGSGSIKLNQASFDANVRDSDLPWLVGFFAPWCGHCKDMKPAWEEAAAKLKGKVNLGSIDGTEENELVSEYKVKGFPTLKWFAPHSKGEASGYGGGRGVPEIIEWVEEKLAAGEQQDDSGASIRLTDITFESKVKDSKLPWLIGFFAPWCGHCKSMKPDWEKAAEKLKGKANLAHVDATTERDLADEYKIRGFPTIKWFPSIKDAQGYSGGRTADEIEDWVLKKLDEEDTEDDLGDAVKLTDVNFDAKVKESKKPWLVGFFAPWCGHCKNIKPAWKEAARKLKGKVNLGSVDATAEDDLASAYEIKSFPTIKFFDTDGEVSEYDGGRTEADIISWCKSKVDGGKSSKSEKKSDKKSSRGSQKGSITLTSSNFNEVKNSDEPWLVGFFAPWCGHCKSMKPAWEDAATELKGKINIGSVDATVETSLAGEYQIRGFPTIKFFPPNSNGRAIEYDGGREKAAIIAWAMDKVKKLKPPPEVVEVTSQKVFANACEGKQLCILSVLPVLLDCQSKCRKKYLAILKKAGEKFKENDWGWLWMEATAQPEIENVVDIGGFGYPAMAVINERKMKFALLRGSFGAEGIHEFLRDLSLGRANQLRDLKELPKFKKTTQWDGKDAAMPEEEEIDLAELGIKTEL